MASYAGEQEARANLAAVDSLRRAVPQIRARHRWRRTHRSSAREFVKTIVYSHTMKDSKKYNKKVIKSDEKLYSE